MVHHLFMIIGFHLLVILLGITLLVSYRNPRLLPNWMAVFFGVLTKYLDVYSEEVQFTILLLLAFGIFLGYYERNAPWRWGILIALWIPLGQLVRIIVDGHFEKLLSEGLLSLLVFIPAVAGSYAGSFLRGLMTRREQVS